MIILQPQKNNEAIFLVFWLCLILWFTLIEKIWFLIQGQSNINYLYFCFVSKFLHISSSRTKPQSLISSTGKSLSVALIFASTNPQYDDRLFIEHEYSKVKPWDNMLCT